jgi:hypothetical protein
MPMRTRSSGLLALAVVALIAGNAPARPYERIARLALQLELQTHELHRELDAYSRTSARFAHLHHDVAEMQRLAVSLHESAVRNSSLERIRSEVRELSNLHRSVEEIIEGLARNGKIGPQGIADLRWALLYVGQTLHDLKEAN